MEAKFGVIGDAHLRPYKPLSRTDSFIEDITNKLKFICNELNKREINTLIIPGDLLDIKTPSKYSLKDIQAVMQQLEVFIDSGIDVISIAGNHDLPNSSRDKIDESLYRFLSKHGYFCDYSDSIKGDITGISFTESDSIEDEIASVTTPICILHEHCFPNRVTSIPSYIVRYFTYSQLQHINPRVKVWVLGHLHLGYPTEEMNGQVFINPYSLTRMDKGYVKSDHKPQLSIYDNGKFEDIYIPVKPAKECFIENEAEFLSKIEDNLDSFINKTESLSEGDLSFDKYVNEKIVDSKFKSQVLERISYYLESE